MSCGVVIPTVDGREEVLATAQATFTTDVVVTIRGARTCGEAWVRGARALCAAGIDYIAFAADDLEAHPGCLAAMIEAIDAGKHPAALVLEPDGRLQSAGGVGWDVCGRLCDDWTAVEWSPTPAISARQWDLLAPHAATLAELHYCSDVFISTVLGRHGVQAVVRTPAVMTHRNHPASRGAGMSQHARAAHDRAVFERWREENP